jgi:hypothetical protein
VTKLGSKPALRSTFWSASELRSDVVPPAHVARRPGTGWLAERPCCRSCTPERPLRSWLRTRPSEGHCSQRGVAENAPPSCARVLHDANFGVSAGHFGDPKKVADLDFRKRAGDENRTRVLSLGSALE